MSSFATAKPASRQTSLDVLKCVAAFFVVVIRTGFPEVIGPYINAFTRIAVPIFFMITGYYYPVLLSKGKTKQHFWKIVKWTLYATAFYFAFDLGIAIIKNDFSNIEAIFTLRRLKDIVLFNHRLIREHLWYFNAIIYVLIIIAIADYFKVRNYLYWLIPLLLIGNYILSFGSTLLYRNFLFTGLPYVLLGCLFREKGDIILQKIPDNKKLIYLFVVLSFMSGIEILLYKFAGFRVHRDHFLMTLPMVLVVFSFALRNPSIGEGSIWATIGQKHSSFIYVIHPFSIFVLFHVFRVGHMDEQTLFIYKIFRPFLVFGFSLLLSVICVKMLDTIKQRRQKAD